MAGFRATRAPVLKGLDWEGVYINHGERPGWTVHAEMNDSSREIKMSKAVLRADPQFDTMLA